AVDRASEIVRAAGHEYGYLNLGGSSMSLLKFLPDENGNTAGKIGVINPRQGKLYTGYDFMAVTAQDICLSSSGDYVQYYDLDGKRYSHIISPFTGYPVNAAPQSEGGIVCASVFGLTAAEGDATTTALMVMGREKAIEYIQSELSGAKVCFVYDNGDGTYTLYTNMQDGDYTVYAEMEIEKI
ncbi:MAG: FAD:protein FMN transferase, partial [Clostridia bacterium]|nr:FAD:protein FMN transferase [Clostridia bacterium]